MKLYSNFTDEELVKAVELMISKDDLKIRDVAETLLNVFRYTEAEVREQLNLNEYLNTSEPLGIL